MAPQPSAGVEACRMPSTSSDVAPAASTAGAAWGAKGKPRSQGWGAKAPSAPVVTGQIQQLKEMGFSEQQARQALNECVWDVNKALDLLFTRGVPMNGECEGTDGSEDANAASPSATASVSKGAADSRPEARSPVPSGKAINAEEPASSGNSPGGTFSAEQSTTASTASSPRSSACAEKSSGNSNGISAPVSPQSGEDSISAPLATAVEEPSREEEAEVTAPVIKQLQRVSHGWEAEASAGQLCVHEGDFVCVWQSSTTEHGWIYAEDFENAEKNGWLPGYLLEELPSEQRWMRASQNMEAAHDSQLSVKEGAVYKVNIETRTQEGWIYAEASGVTTEDAAEGGSCLQAGWVPIFCLEGAAAQE